MFKKIYIELKHHAPFTAFGAVTGVAVVLFLKNIPFKTAYNLFYVFHPIHVLLSGIATASMYELHRCSTTRKNCNIFVLLAVGYLGAIGVATLSDSLLPYLGESLLKMPHREVHIGFIEKWWLINPLAILGVVIAYFWPSTKFSHYGHVLLSTCASLFHILMASGVASGNFFYVTVFLFLFLAVWVPCCVSDIVFPLLFVRKK